jgi:1-acyl-sn-glycerol-3-phosphate acyltransferase
MAEAESLHPRSSWLDARFYDLAFLTGWAGFTLGFSLRCKGMANMPRTGPVLVISNHQSFLDPWIVGISVRRRLTYLARKTLFRSRVFGTIIRALNAVPVDQEGVAKEGLKTIVEQLRMGRGVLVFPEGTRTPDGSLQPLQAGVHLLIRRALPPILPVAIAGAYDAWPMWRKYPIPAPLFLPPSKRTIGLVIGRPLDPERFANLPRAESLASLREEIRKLHEQAERLRRK